MHDTPADREHDFVRVAVQALHEAFGTPVTRCDDANAVLRQYPEVEPASLNLMLALHDAGYCQCAAQPVSP